MGGVDVGRRVPGHLGGGGGGGGRKEGCGGGERRVHG